MIGDRDGRLVEPSDVFNEGIEKSGAIEQAISGVRVQMDKRCWHGTPDRWEESSRRRMRVIACREVVARPALSLNGLCMCGCGIRRRLNTSLA